MTRDKAQPTFLLEPSRRAAFLARTAIPKDISTQYRLLLELGIKNIVGENQGGLGVQYSGEDRQNRIVVFQHLQEYLSLIDKYKKKQGSLYNNVILSLVPVIIDTETIRQISANESESMTAKALLYARSVSIENDPKVTIGKQIYCSRNGVSRSEITDDAIDLSLLHKQIEYIKYYEMYYEKGVDANKKIAEHAISTALNSLFQGALARNKTEGGYEVSKSYELHKLKIDLIFNKFARINHLLSNEFTATLDNISLKNYNELMFDLAKKMDMVTLAGSITGGSERFSVNLNHSEIVDTLLTFSKVSPASLKDVPTWPRELPCNEFTKKEILSELKLYTTATNEFLRNYMYFRNELILYNPLKYHLIELQYVYMMSLLNQAAINLICPVPERVCHIELNIVRDMLFSLERAAEINQLQELHSKIIALNARINSHDPEARTANMKDFAKKFARLYMGDPAKLKEITIKDVDQYNLDKEAFTKLCSLEKVIQRTFDEIDQATGKFAKTNDLNKRGADASKDSRVESIETSEQHGNKSDESVDGSIQGVRGGAEVETDLDGNVVYDTSDLRPDLDEQTRRAVGDPFATVDEGASRGDSKSCQEEAPEGITRQVQHPKQTIEDNSWRFYHGVNSNGSITVAVITSMAITKLGSDKVERNRLRNSFTKGGSIKPINAGMHSDEFGKSRIEYEISVRNTDNRIVGFKHDMTKDQLKYLVSFVGIDAIKDEVYAEIGEKVEVIIFDDCTNHQGLSRKRSCVPYLGILTNIMRDDAVPQPSSDNEVTNNNLAKVSNRSSKGRHK